MFRLFIANSLSGRWILFTPDLVRLRAKRLSRDVDRCNDRRIDGLSGHLSFLYTRGFSLQLGEIAVPNDEDDK